MTDLPRGNDRDDFLQSVAVSRETQTRLDAIILALDEWRGRVNLIGPNEWDAVWMRHVWDSLQIAEMLPENCALADMGSGAGFPALFLAAAKPDIRVTMIERTGKKCAYLKYAAASAGLDVSILNGRVEDLLDPDADVVTARAFAPLEKLLPLAAPALSNGAIGLFHKGKNWQEELTKAQQSWNFAHEAIPSRAGGMGVILKVTELKRVSK